MRILQVIPSLAPTCGGPPNAVLNLSYALARRGQKVAIFTTHTDTKGRMNVSLNSPVNINGVEIYYFPVHWFKQYKFSLSLDKALKKNIPFFDIIHIHSLYQFSSLAASYYCRKYHKPYIIRTIGQLDPFLLRRHRLRKSLYLRLFERKNLERACALHFTTEEEKSWMRHLDFTFNDIVVPMGIDLEEFQDLPVYGTFRFKYPEFKNKKIILFLGRINFKKGLDILVRAFANLARERNDVHLVIAGPDNEGYARTVKNWLSREGISSRAVFTGMLLGKDKLAAFRDSDIFLLPSYSENFGMAVVEAMACGVPVVISNKVGIYRDVNENKAGVVTECNEISIYEGIKSILDNRSFAQGLSFNGRKMVEEYYDINKVADRVIEAYKDILNGRKGIIKEFWDNNHCGIKHIVSFSATKKNFELNEREHQQIEPFIYKYAGFEDWKGREVLEIGCGTGRDLVRFMRQGAIVYGIDFSEKSVVLARKRLNVFGFDAGRIIAGDAEALPFFDNQFDFVYSWGVLHHTPDIEKAVSEIYRVCRPSGKICVMLYHKPSLVALQLYLLYGFRALRPFRGIDEIIFNHLESPGTKAYTESQARRVFKNFNNLAVNTVITRYDLRYRRDKYKNDRFLPAWVGRIIPNFLGWFMIIKGRK